MAGCASRDTARLLVDEFDATESGGADEQAARVAAKPVKWGLAKPAAAAATLLAVGALVSVLVHRPGSPDRVAVHLRKNGVIGEDMVKNTTHADDHAADDEEDEDKCAEAGAGCLKSECCKEPGTQCYTKNAYWAQCMVSCIPGPNVLDQVSPMPWACEPLGNRTPGQPAACSADGEDCSNTKCCVSGGTQCFQKDDTWATCRPECTPGPDMASKDWKPWSCKELGPRTMGAAPWVEKQCAHGGEDCAKMGCCAEPGTQCFRQSAYYAKCRKSCVVGEKLNAWDQPWDCTPVGPVTPLRSEVAKPERGMVASWVQERCVGLGENCLDSQCCLAVNHQCFTKNDYWATCKPECSTEPDPDDDNYTWSCEALGPKSWGLALKGYPSLFCFSLFMPSSYENGLLKSQIAANAGIFACDGYDVFAAENATLGTSKDGVAVEAILIPKISVGTSQDGTAGNAKLFMAVWDKVIAAGRHRNYDWTIKVDPDAVLIPWRIRLHLEPHVGKNVYVVNCNKFPNSPNFPMMYGAVEIFSSVAMDAYAEGSWRCGTELPWGTWGEDYYMTHCLDFLRVGRIPDFGVLGDALCTGANCADTSIGSFHPFKTTDTWMQCWTKATAPPTTAPPPPPPQLQFQKK